MRRGRDEAERTMETKQRQIYYVEDDEAIACTVGEYLGQRGFEVKAFSTIAGAREALESRLPTLALVDWNMPDGNGNSLVRWIRLHFPRLPVILLTIRADSGDIVSGLENGADDYVVKPFELKVLLSRIQALLRRAGDGPGQVLSCGRISLDPERNLVYNGGEESPLSPTEYQLLLCLLENKGRTVTRQRLLERIWDSEGNFVNDNTLTVTMKRLREKLCQPSCLKTVRSVGYRMEEER